MKHPLLFAALSIALCASAQAKPPRFRQSAQPSEVIAAELAFARLAREKGQWTAFRETAAKNAEMFVPQRTSAQAWLKGRANPAQAVRWSPTAVWSSCDGSFTVTSGPWIGINSNGTFATVWQRQKDGKYKWLLDMSLTLDGPSPEIDTVEAKVAECKPAAGALTRVPAPAGADSRDGLSADRTLQWTSSVDPAGNRQLTVYAWNGTGYATVLRANGAQGPR